MTVTDTGWTGRAAALAASLNASGDLHDPGWTAAVAATPRHLLVPVAHRQRRDGTWAVIDTGTPEGLDLVYSPTTLVTALDAQGRAISSSTKPDLMVRMLETLDVHDGHRVLEIGTGTGYNAALLTHRLGADNVFSVDVDAGLVDAARARLAAAGLRPRLAARDGVTGRPEHGPYDRILATCSVPRVPWAWAEQLRPGGMVLVDLKVGTGAGNLVLLHRHADRLEGRFTARWAAFMPMRHRDEAAPAVRANAPEPRRRRVTTAPAQAWNTHREVWLMASLTLPTGVHHGYLLDPATGRPKSVTVSSPDGSRCEVDLDGTPAQVRETGPTPLWDHVERAWARWNDSGRPDWQRFGVTVTSDAMTIWIDRRDNALTR